MGSLLSIFTSNWWTYLAVALLSAGISIAATRSLDANHYNTIIAEQQSKYDRDMKSVSDAAEKAAAENLAKLQGELTQTAADKQAADKALTDAKLTNDALALSLSIGTKRLSVAGACASSGSGVPQAAAAGPAVHAASRCDIDAGAAQRIVAITEEADKTAILLRQCQSYVRTVTEMPQAAASP